MMPSVFYSLVNRGVQLGVGGLARVQRLLAEIPVVLYSPDFERIATNDHYVRYQGVYSGGGPKGLFSFEERALREYFPPPPARILLHGAGGGREMLVLAERGYEVEAYEPVPELVKKAESALTDNGRPRGKTSIRCRSVQSWAEHSRGNFQAVFTGWGMWTHVLQHSERVDVLGAFRRVCPKGPVLLSFWRNEHVFFDFEKPREPVALTPRWKGVERFTRRYLRERLLRLSPIERGTGWAEGFFVHRVTEEELRQEAEMAGYQLAFYERDNFCYPHAVLRPKELTNGLPSSSGKAKSRRGSAVRAD